MFNPYDESIWLFLRNYDFVIDLFKLGGGILAMGLGVIFCFANYLVADYFSLKYLGDGLLRSICFVGDLFLFFSWKIPYNKCVVNLDFKLAFMASIVFLVSLSRCFLTYLSKLILVV